MDPAAMYVACNHCKLKLGDSVAEVNGKKGRMGSGVRQGV